MQASNAIFLHNGGSSKEALYHLSQTFVQVRRRIREDVELSDSTIAIVMSLVIQEQIRSETEQAVVQFLGLRRMIELRGGLSALEGNVELVLKACKCVQDFLLMLSG